ncbi:hypothetical protein [Streptomyces sp. ST2-7A]|uniref:hypothetical protein n=1 Tax=Streptomyces sp. ST2-7A TaxID=2907214 RepID=UPI001F3FF7D0|nr:hypothetical protein [Streptomyces sp. ST2-7A]MCE7079899.1 hypothetical protein [Streptomyces sp. ST2-7A]
MTTTPAPTSLANPRRTNLMRPVPAPVARGRRGAPLPGSTANPRRTVLMDKPGS